MNFSHGSYEYHQSVVDNVRKVIDSEYFPYYGLYRLTRLYHGVGEAGRPLAIALDTVSELSCSTVVKIQLTLGPERAGNQNWANASRRRGE